MTAYTSTVVAAGLLALVNVLPTEAWAEPTSYPLTIDNCGQAATYAKAPQRAVGFGQNSAEIMLALGLEERMVGTAFWPSKVLDEFAEANAKVKLLSTEFPTFESILGERPDFVAAALPSLVGPNSKVAKREDFDNLGIATYLSPSTCLDASGSKDVYGSRANLWTSELLYKEIDELSRIFDVADRGQALIADFRAREAGLRAKVSTGDRKLKYLFWFSSPSPSADAYLGGKNGASGFIADLLGGANALDTETEWPTLGWEAIIAADPDVIVIASLDRNRWELDRPEAKIKFLTTDPAVSQMRAVRDKAIVVMDGQAMNPTLRTIYGAEQVADQLRSLGYLK
ncbi:ABC transporter substrate-binding protein [Pleomorphomonas sp. JP5]|uniref:ABC transporter substrate-binding protein n=1 Tax=Pleomorphomonas sp. JP5 TaxID=2942998 RepID=UPI0020441CD8|nr:ABC transporter substrate-binding protein [Pleomorphomonas sp. JP5]MCM5559960.1 ABC transporter substrate-binding protein [Pleomorphomonas sp. JP5]